MLLAVILITVANIQAQQKLQVSEKDYQKWSTLSGEKISPDGKWISYKVDYDEGQDTLFVHEVKTGNRHAFPNAGSSTFSPIGNWTTITEDDKLHVQNLATMQSTVLNKVSYSEFTTDGKYVAFVSENQDKKNLSFFSSNLTVAHTVEDIVDFKIYNNSVATTNLNSISIHDLNVKKGYLVATAEKPLIFKKLTWDNSGTRLGFFQQDNTGNDDLQQFSIIVHDLKTKKSKELPGNAIAGYRIVPLSSTPLLFSPDASKVFFYVKSVTKKKETSSLVEVWDASTQYEYPRQLQKDDPDQHPMLAMWNTETNEVRRIGTEEYEKVFLSQDKATAIKYNPSQYEPQFDEVAPADIYVESLGSGESKLLMKKHSTTSYPVHCSPSGKLLAFFELGDWWIYNISTGIKTNVTQNIGNFINENNNSNVSADKYYMAPGFTSDSKYLIVYDEYDVWLISTLEKIKITNGRQSNTRFRIEDKLYQLKPQNSAELVKFQIDPLRGFVLTAFGSDKSTEYYFWSKDTGFKKWVNENSRKSRIQKASGVDAYVYVEESYATPPRIMLLSKNKQRPKLLFQSNPQVKNYYWSRSELFTYTTSDKDTLQGIITYPANYIAGKRYPTIVYIYEKLSDDIHEYHNPAMYHQIGFPIANFALDGYIILQPDIKYRLGDPGNSALLCVEAAIKEVLKKDIIDKDRIGLVGHSFGGYQASYIATKSGLFSAIVIGAGVSDLSRNYLTMNFRSGRSNNWRVERQQFRMGVSPFEDYSRYVDNSAVPNASGVTAPILSWFGKSDTQVTWDQGLALHLALRRLNKENIFLVYPDEGHILMNTTAQKDLTIRIKTWLDHHLKG